MNPSAITWLKPGIRHFNSRALGKGEQIVWLLTVIFGLQVQLSKGPVIRTSMHSLKIDRASVSLARLPLPKC
jgi:hypothetical protein